MNQLSELEQALADRDHAREERDTWEEVAAGSELAFMAAHKELDETQADLHAAREELATAKEQAAGSEIAFLAAHKELDETQAILEKAEAELKAAREELATLKAEKVEAIDEEMVPHAFLPMSSGDGDEEVWCADCEYHRDHQIHQARDQKCSECNGLRAKLARLQPYVQHRPLLVIAKASGNRPRVHGNGFVQLDITPEVRLHIWGDERIPRQKVETPIHDHRFGFTSYLLRGALRNVVYRVESNPDGAYEAHCAIARVGQDTVLVGTGWLCDVTVESADVTQAGESYSMERGQIHESQPLGLSVSLIVKDGPSLNQGGSSPLVYVKRGVEPDNEFNRYDADPELLWTIIADALDGTCGLIPLHQDVNPSPYVQQWQPIETAPKDADAILLSDGVTVDVGGWINAAAQGCDPGEEYLVSEGWWFLRTIDMQPTHWMPLPLQPGGLVPVEKSTEE